MNKTDLIQFLNEGIKLNQILQTNYNRTLTTYSITYEEKAASESGLEHAQLCSLINQASGNP